MKIVSHLRTSQYLSTAYDYFVARASADFDTPDPNMVGTSMNSGNDVYCAHLAIDGSWNAYMGRLPDRLWGVIWRTPSAPQGLSVTRAGIKPQVIYTLLLDSDGVLKVQASGDTIWKSGGPPAPDPAGSYFAAITDDGAMILVTGTPEDSGHEYWSSGTDQCRLTIQRSAGFGHTQVELEVTYRDIRGGRPGSLVTLDIGNTAASRSVTWSAMLTASSDAAHYLQGLPAAMNLIVDPASFAPANYNLGVCRALTMSVADTGVSFPLGLGVIASA